MTLNDLIVSTGVKKEHLVKVSKISRNKFFKCLHKPHLFRIEELERIAIVLKVDKQVIIDIALTDGQTSRPHH
jgi:hypothetical protein